MKKSHFTQISPLNRVATGQWEKIQPKIANSGIVFQQFSHNFSKKTWWFSSLSSLNLLENSIKNDIIYKISIISIRITQWMCNWGMYLIYNPDRHTDVFWNTKYFKGRKFYGDKLWRTCRAKIKFCGYKLSQMKEILGLFSYLRAIFCCSLIDISRMSSEVRFRGINFRDRRKFSEIAKLSTRETFYQ